MAVTESDPLVKLGLSIDEFTPTEKNILRLLSDGQRHHKSDIKKVLFDDQALDSSLSKYVSVLKVKLEKYGLCIVNEYYKRRFYYRFFRLLS